MGYGYYDNKKLDEKNFLQKIGVNSYSEIDKEIIPKVIDTWSDIDPDVKAKIIQCIPEFVESFKGMVDIYSKNIDNAYNSNENSVNNFYSSTKLILTSLDKLLNQENLTFEEKKYVIDKMEEIAKMGFDKDSENKEYNLSMAEKVSLPVALGLVAIVGITGLLLLKNKSPNEIPTKKSFFID